MNAFTCRKSVEIIKQVLKALSYIHNHKKKKIIHRDLKPSNVMLSQGKVKLIDFGIAKDFNRTDLTRTGTLSTLGTELYMAPEQWQNEATERSDIYACGILLGCLLGKSPDKPNQHPLLLLRKWMMYQTG